MTLPEVLEKYWGYTTFRPLQEDAMHAILSRRDSVVVLPLDDDCVLDVDGVPDVDESSFESADLSLACRGPSLPLAWLVPSALEAGPVLLFCLLEASALLLLLLLVLFVGWFAGGAFCHELLLAAGFELLLFQFCWAGCCWDWAWAAELLASAAALLSTRLPNISFAGG